MGGREGLIDTAVKTSETGYIQRRLVKVPYKTKQNKTNNKTTKQQNNKNQKTKVDGRHIMSIRWYSKKLGWRSNPVLVWGGWTQRSFCGTTEVGNHGNEPGRVPKKGLHFTKKVGLCLVVTHVVYLEKFRIDMDPTKPTYFFSERNGIVDRDIIEQVSSNFTQVQEALERELTRLQEDRKVLQTEVFKKLQGSACYLPINISRVNYSSSSRYPCPDSLTSTYLAPMERANPAKA